ncbi:MULTISPECIES: MBL fold metallo-hydrolase [unclassified Sinorhizobium]|uniref:MBL fold metallo-hydrolase n=1 Tax=unclassified Sinorhizobium TaxID=2613772 RepID=UPI00352329BD
MIRIAEKSELSNPERRAVLAGGISIAALSLLPKSVYAADIHRFSNGAFDITVVSDGFLTLPAEVILPDAAPEEREPILKRLGGNAASAPFQANIPLIRTGNDLILIDVGSGTNFQASAGRLADNLKTAGVDPAAITKIVLTHAHPDHSGALTTREGKLLYPNADYFVSEAEWQFWMDPDYEKNMPSVLHDFARGAQRDLSAIRERVTTVKAGDEIVSGIQVLDTRGHTPGHISLQLAGGDGLIITGDAATSNVVFFEHPGWHFGFDTDAEVALANRRALIDQAATERVKMLGYHWAYPGVGYAERAGNAYRFVAA